MHWITLHCLILIAPSSENKTYKTFLKTQRVIWQELIYISKIYSWHNQPLHCITFHCMILIAPSQEARLTNHYLNYAFYLTGISNITLQPRPLKLTVQISLIISNSEIIIPSIVVTGLGTVSTISIQTHLVYLTIVLVDTYCSFLRCETYKPVLKHRSLSDWCIKT